MNIDILRDNHELVIISYIVKNPKNKIILKTNVFENQTYRNIYNIITKHDIQEPLDRLTIFGYMMDEEAAVGSKYVDIIFQYIEENKIDEQQAKSAVFNLNRIIDVQKMVTTLDDAKNKIQQGSIKEGIMLAKSISFKTDKNVLDTYSLMEKSIWQHGGFLSGIKQIDRSEASFIFGNMASIGGDSGPMKTAVSLWLCIEILKMNPNFTCNYFEKEMPALDIGRRLVQMLIKRTAKQLVEHTTSTPTMRDLYSSGKFSSDIETTKEMLKQKSYADLFVDEIRQLKDTALGDALGRLKVIPPNQFHDAYDMYEIIETNRPQIWCLDFVTMLGSSKGKSSDYFSYLSNQLEIIKNMTIDTYTFGILLNQLSMHKISGKTNKIPGMDDFEWGAKVKQFSSWVWATFYPRIYYPEGLPINKHYMNQDYFYLTGLKARTGPAFDIMLTAVPQFAKFHEPEEVDSRGMATWLREYRNFTKNKYSK